MSKYTKKEQEFLDKAAITAIPGIISNPESPAPNWEACAIHAYEVAKQLLTERKKLYESNNNTDEPQVESVNYCNGGCGKIIPDGHRFCSDGCTKAWAFD